MIVSMRRRRRRRRNQDVDSLLVEKENERVLDDSHVSAQCAE
jgi:hypothetical protein